MTDDMKLTWMEHLPTHPEVTDGMLRTALRLAKYADRHGRDMWPGPARLARETTPAWSDMTAKQRENRTHVVERHLRALVKASLIHVTKVGGIVDGRRVASEYAMEEWWTGDPAVTGREDRTGDPAVTGDSTVTDTGDPAVTVTGDPAAPPPLQYTPTTPLQAEREANVYTSPDTPVPTETQQIAAAYGTTTDVAALMLTHPTVKAKDYPARYLLKNPEWATMQNIKQQAQQQLHQTKAGNAKAAEQAEAEQVLGPCPTDGPMVYRWQVAAAAYRTRDQYPGRWEQERDDWLAST